MAEDPGDSASPGLVERGADRPDPARVAEQVGEVEPGLLPDHRHRHRDGGGEHHGREHRRAPAPHPCQVHPGDGRGQFDPRGQAHQETRHPPSGTDRRPQRGQYQDDVDLSVVEGAAQRLDPDADRGPQHGDGWVSNADQPQAQHHDAVERGDDAQLPAEGDHSEGELGQRIEHQRRERRIGERQREVGGLVAVDVRIQRAGLVQRRGAAEVDVQVDEVRPVGDQIGPRQPRGDADQQQHRRDLCQPAGEHRRDFSCASVVERVLTALLGTSASRRLGRASLP